MTENSESTAAGKAHTSSRNPALEGDSGQYVEGDYGDAGVVGDEAAAADEGEYAEGDYGNAGAVRAASDEVEEGEYPEGDYGKAGTAGQERPGGEGGEYPEGNYGATGTARESEAADDLKDELADGQINAPRKDDGGTSSGG
ncbi:hypothetical protein [Arthrobacter sp. ISL-28]|uniref:hypothetical protein n=1 Tax=Arthrobacter sp. ISL-28 TaxID=2819108 RepID=UPI001BE631E9|nr:hypothetical protein [Arthrobacter sp. ISL-28]MBT2521515.1 hypothetical protein [Arthrobacter sp. ISL-28]